MEREYLKCKNGLTSQCPHVDTESMQKFIVKPSYGGSTERFTATDLEARDLICSQCSFFELREE